MISNSGVKIVFQDLVQRILKHSGFQINNKVEIKSIEYHQFWELINIPENASQFVIELVKLIDSTENSKKVKIYNLENLLCTLLTICMFRRIDIEKRRRELNEAKAHWENQLNTKKQLTNPYTCSLVYHIMQWQMENDENSFIGYILGSLVFLHDVYKITKPENIEANYDILRQHYKTVEDNFKNIRVKNDQFYNSLLDERFDLTETGEYMFCYEFILKYIKQKQRNAPRIIYDAIIKYLKMIPFLAQDFPEHAEKSLLALLHMIKQFITFFSCDIPEVLKTLLHQVEIFRRWPFPMGVMAQELVNIIYQEWKFRGSSFRMKLREDIPEIDFYFDVQEEEEKQIEEQSQSLQQIQNGDNQSLQNIEYRPNQKHILQVFTFIDDKMVEMLNVLQFTQNQVRYTFDQNMRNYSPHALRTYIVAQILGLEIKMSTDKQLLIASIPEHDLFKLYCKMLLIIEKCDTLDSAIDIKMIQGNAFDEIFRDISRKKYEPTELQEIFRSVIGDNTLIIPEYPTYQLHSMGKSPLFVNPAKYSINKDAQLQTPNDYGAIKRAIQSAYDNYLPLHTEPLRLLVVGGDSEINKVCFLFGELYESNPFLFRTLDIRVYIVPSRECALAQFLAVKDPWYQRYLYLPLMEDILIPKIDNIKDDKKDGFSVNLDKIQQNNQLPLELKSSVLNTFLREANRAYNVRVYKIKIWQKPNPPGGVAIPMQTTKFEYGLNPITKVDGTILSKVFFCTSVMVGAAAEFECSKEKDEKDKIQKMSFYDYKEKNLCKFQFIPITMKTDTTDMLGNVTRDPPFNVQMHSCKINNVYTDFFEGNMPMPHTDWLELSYISYENSKVFDNNLRQKNLFKKHSKENLQNAFMSLFTNMSIVKLTLEESQGKTFTIVADGKLYQHINKMKISNVKMKKSKIENLTIKSKNLPDLSSIIHLNMPVMSFLPFKV